MRTVLRNHSEVCLLWAQQKQFRGRASNIRFEGRIIYSYGWWPMAQFVKSNVVLYRNETYSVSTSSHQSLVRQALSPLRDIRVYTVGTLGDDVQNMLDYVYRVRKEADTFWNCRNFAEDHKIRYEELVAESIAYNKEFNLDFQFPPLFGLELSGKRAKEKLGRTDTA